MRTYYEIWQYDADTLRRVKSLLGMTATDFYDYLGYSPREIDILRLRSRIPFSFNINRHIKKKLNQLLKFRGIHIRIV